MALSKLQLDFAVKNEVMYLTTVIVIYTYFLTNWC